VGRCPERALTIKGFTLEAMGEYERAVETLLQAAPRVDRQADPRLWYNHRINLAVVFCHLGRCAEAAELVPQIRGVAAELGDAIFLCRVTWLEGRVAAGLGRRVEALSLLEEARRAFEQRKMFYDVALALLEEAVLLLEDGRTAEVKALADELVKVFAENGVHREALAALQLFVEAVKREEATAELARRVLRFLFRAQHDPELRFEAE
jgi:tetratricopeptide (TPR) repeat protein